MKLSEELKARGFINQFSGESLEQILDGEKRTFYLGADPTATSLTIGNLAVYMLVRHLVDAGFKPILLIGGATGMIGDPGGKESERKMLSTEVLAENTKSIKKQVENILGVDDVQVVNNADWLNKFNMIDFLRDVGKYFTVNSMIKKDIVKNRLDAESPISFTEFSYSLLQGYDFLHLYNEHNCTLQVGGSDQWANIVAGVNYLKKRQGVEAYALAMPLTVNPTTGKKFGKSEEGAIWLNPELTSPYKMYQYLLNVDDAGVVGLLKIYTLLSLEEIAELEQSVRDNPQERKAQKTLAYEVTKFVHGESAADAARGVSDVLFGNKDTEAITDAEIEILKKESPTMSVSDGTTLVDVLVGSKLVTSKTEARTMIEGGAVSISDVKILDTNFALSKGDFINGIALLRKGKKNIVVLTLA